MGGYSAMETIIKFLKNTILIILFFLCADANGFSNNSNTDIRITEMEEVKYSLYDDYQAVRDEYLADGGEMRHEEFSTHHFAVKVKKKGRFMYIGTISYRDKQAKMAMESEAECDKQWHERMLEAARKIGMTDAEIASDGL